MKNAVIFGDSYSTFAGYIPEGNETWYSEVAEENRTDVCSVKETWWHQVASEADLNVILNDSWSGSTVCHTGYSGADCSETSSFICRLDRLVSGRFFKENPVDVVFVFGGTNDSWADSPLGEVMFDGFTKKDLFSVLPAISYFFKTLRQQLPEAEIYCLTNTDIKEEIASGMATVCRKYGARQIRFDHIHKTFGHPNVQGMTDIKNGVLNAMNK